MSRPPARLLLATRNAGKVRELRAMLAPLGVEVVSIADLEAQRGPAPQPDETGTSFLENALIKARAYAAWAGIPVIAEDSGIEVDALGGAPGIYSSRFAGREGDDVANNRLLLERLAGVPWERRRARYRSVAVYLATPEAEPVVGEGRWEGYVTTEPRGEGGFGYDPLFWVPERDRTAAELAPEEKNALSHRRRALTALLTALGWTVPVEA